MYFSLLIDYYY